MQESQETVQDISVTCLWCWLQLASLQNRALAKIHLGSNLKVKPTLIYHSGLLLSTCPPVTAPFPQNTFWTDEVFNSRIRFMGYPSLSNNLGKG